MDAFRISRILLLALLVACAPLAAQTPTVDTTSVTITYTGSTFPSPQSVNVSNASNVTARISANIQSDGTVANTASGVFVQNVTPTSATTATVNIGVDSNVLGTLARRGASTYTGAKLLISATGCVDCVAVSLNLSITNGGSLNITYNGAPIPSSGLQLFAGVGGSTSAQLTLAATNPTAFTASSNVTWLIVSPTSGNLSGFSASQIITLSLFAAGLPTGVNSATVTVNAAGITTNIPILFNVGTTSGLTSSPNPMNFQYVTSTASFPTGQTQYLTISGASSAATYSATAFSSPAWLLVGAGGGTSVTGLSVFSQLPVSVNVAALNLQATTTYQGTVNIQTSDGLASTLTVNLTISATGGTGTGSLTFSVATPGGAAPPAQQVAISGSGFFTAFASTSTCGQGWLQVSPNSGQLSAIATPLTVSVLPGFLSAGTCTGTISISTNGLLSNGTSSQTINVSMVIGGSTVSGPVASPTSLVFNLPAGSTQTQQQTFIVNGNGTSYSTQTFGNFTVTPANGTTPAIVTVTAGPSSSSGTIVVTSSLGTQNVTVTVTTPSGNVLTATPGSLSYIYQTGTVVTTNVSINASLDSSGSNLTFSVASAPSFVSYAVTSTTTPSTIGVGINAAQLAPGINTGNIVITSTSGATLSIPITVLAPGSTSGLVATPNPATVSGTPFGSPVTQTISLTGLSTSFSASASSSGNWLSVSPTFGTSPTTLTITANPVSLGQNTYSGTVTLTSATTGATLLSIPVSFNVGTTGTGTPVLAVTPTTVTFNYSTGDPSPTPQGISISTTNGVATNFTATTTAPWISLSQGAGSTPSKVNISVNPSLLSSGTQTGTVTIAASGATSQTVTVTANVIAPPVLTLNTSSASFSYRTGDPAPPSQSIQVNSSGAALPFTVSVSNAAWLSVTPTSGTTPATLTLTPNPSGLAVGQYSASVTINASGSSETVTVTLTVSAPLPTISEVHNGASNLPGPIAPGLIIVITGSAIGPDTIVSPAGNVDFTTTLGSTRVLVGGFASPMVYTSATQVSAIVPYEIAGRTSTFVQVEYLGQRSNAVTVQVANTAPGIFTLNSSGTGPGAILNQDGSVNSASNAESVNRSIVVFATGEGQTIPAGVDGRLANDPVLPKPVLPVTATINNVPAEVQYAGAAPGLVAGVLQVNLLVPPGATSGNVVLHIGGNDSQDGVTVAIR